jgi:hypothetical protein
LRWTTRIPLTLLALGAVIALSSAPAWQATQSVDAANARMSRQDFHDAMRKLWEDHITWTRMFIVSKATLAEDLPDIGPTVERLLQNQTDIGDAIEPFYGADAAAALTSLLETHILQAAEILTVAKAGGDPTAAIDRWYANAHDIAVFLNAANPQHWPLEDLDTMMRDHLTLTLEEAVARLEARTTGNYAVDIAKYDQVHLQILEMADMLSDGIIRQFPQAFAPVP